MGRQSIIGHHAHLSTWHVFGRWDETGEHVEKFHTCRVWDQNRVSGGVRWESYSLYHSATLYFKKITHQLIQVIRMRENNSLTCEDGLRAWSAFWEPVAIWKWAAIDKLFVQWTNFSTAGVDILEFVPAPNIPDSTDQHFKQPFFEFKQGDH